MDGEGKIKKSDFIEFSMEARLLDLTESGKGRKTVADKKQAGGEEVGKNKNVRYGNKNNKYLTTLHTGPYW